MKNAMDTSNHAHSTPHVLLIECPSNLHHDTMKPSAMCITSLVFMLHSAPSVAFVPKSGAALHCPVHNRRCSMKTSTTTTRRRCGTINTSSLKRSRPLLGPKPVYSTTGRSSLQASQGGDRQGGNLLELDVVEYSVTEKDGERVELGAYVGNGKVQPLLTRESSGPQLFFHDEDAESVSLDGGSCRVVRVVDEVYYSQRIVEDRVKNPHGEEAEDCFLLEGSLNPAVVVRVERDG